MRDVYADLEADVARARLLTQLAAGSDEVVLTRAEGAILSDVLTRTEPLAPTAPEIDKKAPLRNTASYTTPPRPPTTVDDIVQGAVEPPRAAFALEWTPGDGERALAEAAKAYDAVILNVFGTLISDTSAADPAPRALHA